MRKLLTVTALALLTASPALAARWNVDAANSSLTFTGSQSGEAFSGGFKTFTPVIDFDPAHPETGKIDVTVAMASATIDGKDRMDALPSSDWFATSAFPTAQFTSSHITAVKTKPGAFEAAGTLTIRGISKPATLTFILTPQGKATRAEGDLTLNRRDFSVGEGRWADDKWIAFPVAVHTVITATPQ
ncbi:MAG: YceI family protein [Pseudomonadota bacterium]